MFLDHTMHMQASLYTLKYHLQHCKNGAQNLQSGDINLDPGSVITFHPFPVPKQNNGMIIYLENTKAYSKNYQKLGEEIYRSLVTKFICRNQQFYYILTVTGQEIQWGKVFLYNSSKNNKYNTKCSEPKFKNEKNENLSMRYSKTTTKATKWNEILCWEIKL